MTSPRVTVVIPTFNYRHFVCDAVDSALAQTYENVEVLVVDDGSTDDTRGCIATYGERIRYIYQPNQGLSAARNTGIAAATGEWIAFLDSDDALHPQKIELQLKAIAADPDFALVASHSLTGADLPQWEPQDDTDLHITPIPLERIAIRTLFSVCSVLVKKDCLTQLGGFDVSLKSVEDRDMWVRIASQYRIGMLDRTLCWYRKTPGSMSNNVQRMEKYDRMVIEKSFSLPALRRRYFTRQKAIAHLWTWVAWAFMIRGETRTAMRYAMWSCLAWPLPYRQNDYPFVRLRIILRCIRDLVHCCKAAPSGLGASE